MMHVISLGAGVQSTTMALMAAKGEITPMPDCAIFADTQAEPKAVYKHLEWLMSPGVLPFSVHVISAGNIAEDLRQGFSKVASQGRFVSAPFFIKKKNESNGSFILSAGRRQCTRHYKIDILTKKQRELLGYKPRTRIPAGAMTVWIGISLDEAIRAKQPRYSWQINRHPLLEKRMTRKDCLDWLRANKYPLPAKSACVFCPYRDDVGWREMKDNQPQEFEDACKIDDTIRTHGHMRKWRNELFVHRSLKPLREVDLSTREERGQINMFNNECEGICGV